MNWRDFWFLVIGLFVGANVGLFLLSLCFAARRGDDMAQSSQLINDGEIENEIADEWESE